MGGGGGGGREANAAATAAPASTFGRGAKATGAVRGGGKGMSSPAVGSATSLGGAATTATSSTSLLSLMMMVRSTRRDLRWRRLSDLELDLDLDLDLDLGDLPDLPDLERCLEEPPALRRLLDLRLVLDTFIS